jgi:hypothetical protein
MTTTYEICSLKRNEIQNVRERATWRADWQIWKQFENCANGGEGGATQCLGLLDIEGNVFVGFLGFTLASENLGSAINAYVAIEFVYLDQMVRGQKLSRHFADHVVVEVDGWLNVNEQAWKEADVQLHSMSTIKSDAGERFVLSIEKRLRREARTRQWSFVSSIEGP